MSEIAQKIKRLKEKRKAVILAHNYQLPEIQDIADFIGDSLGLSLQAGRTDAEVLIFCGVYFMAETAKIISPQKKVLIPEPEAGCPMADMITADELRVLKKAHPNAKVLCYVNTTAEVKAESDLCCTSANAVKMVGEALKDSPEIIFVPDKYLASYLSSKTGRQFVIWNGYCPTHAKILAEHVLEQKKIHPRSEILVHPECLPEVIKLGDKVFSTEGMIKYCREAPGKEFIIGTEGGILYRLKKENPAKLFYPASPLAICPNMKLITLEKVLTALEDLTWEVKVPQEIILKAQKSLQRMLDFVE